MLHNACRDQVEVDVTEAASQVTIALPGRHRIPVFPDGTLAPIELLRCAAGYQLHTLRSFTITLTSHQQMSVIRGGGAIMGAQAIAPACLVQPPKPLLPVLHEFQQELLLLTAMRDVPQVICERVTNRPRHLVRP
jgi:hypothetical protein